jgi:DNA polymerase II
LDEEWVQSIEPLSTPWEIDPTPIPLRILTLAPDCNPAIRKPKQLHVKYGQREYSLSLDAPRPFLIGLKADLQRLDPDLILTDYGDTWLFPQLAAWSKETGIELNPNRDENRQVLTRKADSYFCLWAGDLSRRAGAFVRTLAHRPQECHVFWRIRFGRRDGTGACHRHWCAGDGAQVSRRRHHCHADADRLAQRIMVPVQKQQVEGRKTLAELIRADHGGLDLPALDRTARECAQIDFSSMYPAIMVKHNISPETVGLEGCARGIDTKNPASAVGKAPDA